MIKMLPVPLVRQASNFTCGVAALMSCLYYWRAFDGREDELITILGGVKKYEGTSPWQLAKGAMAFGLLASVQTNMTVAQLKDWVERGVPVIVSFQAWQDEDGPPHASWGDIWEDGHCAVVTAVDNANVYFADPSEYSGYCFLPIHEFEARWHDHFRGERCIRGGVVIAGLRSLSAWPGEEFVRTG